MTSTHDTTNPNDRAVQERHSSLRLGNGDVVIYDDEDFSGWIQSDAHVTLSEKR